MVEWLAPIALFWSITALYLGGFKLNIEGGSGVQQILGVLITYVLYLAVWFGLRAVLRGATGAVLAVAFACLIASLLMPILSRVGFRIVGVRITKAAGQH